MCGIAGFFSKQELVPSSTLEAMTVALKHRGPDDQGFFGVEPGGGQKIWKEAGDNKSLLQVGMGFRRLSILDLSPRGAQPMRTDDGRFTLCFNGQIYNYVELRKELSGVQFRSTSDTEVLLQAYAKWGIDALNRFNGIYAFAIFDRERRELVVARDHLGIKPLYYFQDSRGFFFSSEIRSLIKGGLSSPSLRVPLVSRYLMANWVPDPDTLLEGIKKLEPGHFLKLGPDRELRNHEYWDMKFEPDESVSKAEWINRLENSLTSVVDRQLRSDVPVAFFLSGGVDSSLLAAKALKARPDRPTTFTIGFHWSSSKDDGLDLASARLLKNHFGFDHNELILEPSIVKTLPKVIDALEEPLTDPAAICSYLICEAASSRFKVLVSGQGGDELFGGYPVYQAGYVAKHLQHLPSFLVELASRTSQLFPYSVEGFALPNVHRFQKLFLAVQRPWPEPFLLLRSAMRTKHVAQLLSRETLAAQYPPFSRHLQHFERARHWDIFHQMMYLDIKTYLPSTNLAYSDKTSMANSVELRVPFLDREIVDLVSKMPSRFKVSLQETKMVLKAAASRVLPPEIVNRKKTGFGLPLRDWFRNDLQEMAGDLLNEARLRRQGIFEPSVATRWLKEHREMKSDHGMRLYSLMAFQLWAESLGLRS